MFANEIAQRSLLRCDSISVEKTKEHDCHPQPRVPHHQHILQSRPSRLLLLNIKAPVPKSHVTSVTTETNRRTWGITALSAFFLLGAVISLGAGVSLAFPKGLLESMWRLNPRAHVSLSSLGVWAILLLLTVSILCAVASVGLWRGSRLGYWTAVSLIAINLIGDVTNVMLGTEPKAIIGIPIAASLLVYLLRKRIRNAFS